MLDVTQLQVAPVVIYLITVTLYLAHYAGLVKSLRDRVEKLEKSHENIGALQVALAKVETTLESMNENVKRLIAIHDKSTERGERVL